MSQRSFCLSAVGAWPWAVAFVIGCSPSQLPGIGSNTPDVPADTPPTDAPADAPEDVSTVDASSTDAPRDAGGDEVPGLDVPSVDVPSLDVPTLDVPTLDVPTLDVPTLDVRAVDAPTVDAPLMGDASCEAGLCRRVVLGDPLEMSVLGNAGQTVTMGADRSYSLPYPLAANCADSELCSPMTGMVLNNHVQWPRPWPQTRGIMERAVGFVVGLTAAAPPASADAGAGGFVVAGPSAGPTDLGTVAVFFVDPASPGDPFDGSNEYGFVRHTGDQGRGQQLVFYQQYGANTGACQSNSTLVDLSALGFDPTLTGSCLQAEVLPSGDFAVSQYPMTGGRCVGPGAVRTVSTVVEGCSVRGTCRPIVRPARCTYDTSGINFYTGRGTHYPASADPSSPSGTNGFLYGVVKKTAGAASAHAGTSLSGTFQLLQLR